MVQNFFSSPTAAHAIPLLNKKKKKRRAAIALNVFIHPFLSNWTRCCGRDTRLAAAVSRWSFSTWERKETPARSLFKWREREREREASLLEWWPLSPTHYNILRTRTGTHGRRLLTSRRADNVTCQPPRLLPLIYGSYKNPIDFEGTRKRRHRLYISKSLPRRTSY